MWELIKQLFAIFMRFEEKLPEGDFEFEDCGVCNGKGKIWPDGADDYFQCGHCRGTGQIAVPCTEIPPEEVPPESPADEQDLSNVTPIKSKEDTSVHP